MRRQLITFGRIVRTGLQNFARNLTLAVAAMAVMVITLTIVLFSVIVNATFANTVQQITDKIDVSFFLKDSVNEEKRLELISQVKSQSNVKSVEYITKEQALDAYKEQNADNVDLLVAISQTDNPLPASLKIKYVDPSKPQELRNFLSKPEIVALQSDETNDSGDRREAIDKITKATVFFRQAGLIGISIFMLVSILIIFNTIRMAIFNRRDELTIMRLLGASTRYIRGPFIVETVLYGIISAVISIAAVGSLFAVSSNAFGASSLGLLDIQFANDYYADNFWAILSIQLLIGIFIGAFSSYIATRRYLKFKTPRKA